MPARYKNHRDANEADLLAVFERVGGAWFEAGPLDGWACFRGEMSSSVRQIQTGALLARHSAMNLTCEGCSRFLPLGFLISTGNHYACTGAMRTA